MPTVSQQMPDEERRTRLIKGLQAGGGETVVLNVSHLCQAVGMAKAESLVLNLVSMNSLESSPYSKKLTQRMQGMAEVNRVECLKACLDAASKKPVEPPKK